MLIGKIFVSLHHRNKKTLNIMPATATKTRAVSTKINNNTGKKLSYSQQKKAINEISKSMNAGMTRKYLFDMLFKQNNDTHNR